MAPLRATLAGDERGATAIEYAILAALIAIGLVGALGVFGEQLLNLLMNVGDEMPSAST